MDLHYRYTQYSKEGRGPRLVVGILAPAFLVYPYPAILTIHPLFTKSSKFCKILIVSGGSAGQRGPLYPDARNCYQFFKKKVRKRFIYCVRIKNK